MRERENVIEAAFVSEAKDNGWFVKKLLFDGCADAPDRIMIKDGKVIFVELKRPNGKPRPSQEYMFDTMREYGAKVFVISTRKQIDKLFKDLAHDVL